MHMHIILYTCLHALYREGHPKSISQAIGEANNDNLEWYLPLTDSIIGMIKCHDLNRVANGDKKSLERVGLYVGYTRKVLYYY